jgi:hypothetical protein
MTTNIQTIDRPWVPGAILIGIGTIFFAAQWFEAQGAFVLGAVAFVFLAISAATRQIGFLIPGAIIGGLALGVGLEEAGYEMNGAAVVLGLAAGFLSIFVANVLTRAPVYWWPLIPGGILAIVGGSNAVGGTDADRFVALAWPLVLIAVGLLVLYGSTREALRKG